MQVLPSKQLTAYIKHYLFLESEQKSVKKLRLFSDGNAGMVFSFKNNLIAGTQHNTLLHHLPASFIYGQINAFKDLYMVDDAALTIVVFQPAGIKQLTGISQAGLRDNTVTTEDVFGKEGLLLHEKLFAQQSTDSKVKLLNAFFTQLMVKKDSTNHVLIDAALDFIIQHKGACSITALVKYTGYTERQIERTFIEYIGLGPKKFGNIVKLHHFLKLLKNKPPHDTLTALCYEAGYADQSHLIKEFRKHTGITPKEYVHQTYKLTSNLMEFNSLRAIPMSDLYNFRGTP